MKNQKSYLPKIKGNPPFFEPPTTTTFELLLFANSNVASIPFH